MTTSLKDGRYARQVILPCIGEEGQQKLLGSRVTLIGCGALGTGISNNLVRAGVGHVRICDRDFVELNNLQRQTLFEERDVEENMPKAEAAARLLNRINSDVHVESVVADINFMNIEELIADADLVMDGVDNFQTRYLINDVCVKKGTPWVYGGCVGTYGIVMPIQPGETPCLRCAFPSPAPAGFSPTCDTAGVLNASAMIVACLQSTEALKFLSGNREAWIEGILNVDAWTNTYSRFKVKRDPDCICCGRRKFEFLEGTEGMQLTSLCGRNAVQIVQKEASKLKLEKVAETLAPLGEVRLTKFLLKFFVDDFEVTLFPDGRAIVKGTNDESVAKTVYSKYVGT